MSRPVCVVTSNQATGGKYNPNVAHVQSIRPFFLFGCIAILLLVGLVHFLRGDKLLVYGPQLRVADTAISIWQRGTVEQNFYYSLDRMLTDRSRRERASFWQDAYALSKNGHLYPKHCLLLSCLAAPFYGLFGYTGFWLLNQLLILVIALAIYRLSSWSAGQDTSLGTLLVLFGGTQTILHAYTMSYDLFGSALVLVGLVLAAKHPFLGGLIMSLTATVRISNIVMLPLLWLAVPLSRAESKRQAFLWSGVGLVTGLAGLCIVNLHLWGGPFITSYNRLPIYCCGVRTIDTSSHFVAFAELCDRVIEKLFSTRNGLLLYNPSLWLLPVFLLRIRRRRHGKLLLAISAAAVMNILVIFSYSQWGASEGGNRFLFPSVHLLAVFIAVEITDLLPSGLDPTNEATSNQSV